MKTDSSALPGQILVYFTAKSKHQTISLRTTSSDTLKCMAIEVIPSSLRGGDRLKRLLQRETFWIYTLRSSTHSGLNEEIDYSPFLQFSRKKTFLVIAMLYVVF